MSFEMSFGQGVWLQYCYRPSKMEESERTGPSSKIKKRHAFINGFFGLKQIEGPLNHVRRPCYSFQVLKIDIVAVSFFRNASISAIFFSEFDLTLTADNYGLKPPNLENYHIFGMLWTCPFTWHHPR